MRFPVVRVTTTSSSSRFTAYFCTTTSNLDPPVTIGGITAPPQTQSQLYNRSLTPLIANVGIPGAPTTPCPTNFTIQGSESNPIEWTMPFKAAYAIFSQYCVRGGWQGVMGISKPMSFNAEWGGNSFSFSGLSVGDEESRKGGRPIMDLQWKGQDLSQLLFVPDCSMPAVRNRLASYVVQEILAFCCNPSAWQATVNNTATVGTNPLGYTAGATLLLNGNSALYQDSSGSPLPSASMTWNLAQIVANDWVIPYMPRLKGRPIDWIMQILDVLVLEWKMVNGTIFTPYLVNPIPTSCDFIYPAGSIVHEVPNDSTHLQPIINQVIVRIVREVTTTIAPSSVTRQIAKAAVPPSTVPTLQPTTIMQLNVSTPAIEASSYGPYTASWSPPVNDVRWVVLSSAGGIWSDFLFKDPSGKLFAVREPRAATSIPQSSIGFSSNLLPGGNEALYPSNYLSAGITNCASVTATFGEAPSDAATPGINAYGPGFGKIEFSGTRPTAVPVPQKQSTPEANLPTKTAPYDPNLAIVVNDLVSQGFVKRVYTLDESPNSLIDNITTGLLHGQRKLMRMSRQLRESTWIIPLNSNIECGSTVFIEDIQLGVWRYLTVKAWEHSFSTNALQRGTTIHCCEYFYAPANALAGLGGTPVAGNSWTVIGGVPVGQMYNAIGYASGSITGLNILPSPSNNIGGSNVISNPPSIVISQQPSDVILTAIGGSASFSINVQATNNPTIVYQWFLNGSPIPGATSSRYTISEIISESIGAYYCQATCAIGTATSQTVKMAIATSVTIQAWGGGGAGSIAGNTPDGLTIGGTGGSGAYWTITLPWSNGDTITSNIGLGAIAGDPGSPGAGGGSTWVYLNSSLILCCGGGGGAGMGNNGGNAVSTVNGAPGFGADGGSGGVAGGGGSAGWGAGGGGLSSNGASFSQTYTNHGGSLGPGGAGGVGGGSGSGSGISTGGLGGGGGGGITSGSGAGLIGGGGGGGGYSGGGGGGGSVPNSVSFESAYPNLFGGGGGGSWSAPSGVFQAIGGIGPFGNGGGDLAGLGAMWEDSDANGGNGGVVITYNA